MHFKIPNSPDPLKQFKDMLYLSQVILNNFKEKRVKLMYLLQEQEPHHIYNL
jgi:hypothetical protein